MIGVPFFVDQNSLILFVFKLWFTGLYLLYACLLDETEIVLTARVFVDVIFHAKGALKSKNHKYRA